MSDLQTSIIELAKGLDLTSSKLSAAPGSLLSCLNYEITDTKGLSRIDGYERYDGRDSVGLTSLYVIKFASAHGVGVNSIITVKQAIIGTTTITENLLQNEALDTIWNGTYTLAWDVDTTATASTAISGITRDIVLGRVAKFIDSTTVVVKVSNLDFLGIGTTAYSLSTTTGLTSVMPAITSITALADYYTSATTMYTDMVTWSTITFPNTVGRLDYPAAALHHFRDTTYAVAPLQRYNLFATNAGASDQLAGTYTHTIAAGTWLGNSVNSATAFVVAMTESTDGGGVKRIAVDMIPSDFTAWRTAINTIGVVLTNTGFAAGTVVGSVGMSLSTTTTTGADCLVGTLYRSYSEQQLIDAGGAIIEGWRPINLGYLVNFASGTAASGSLTKLERSFATVPTSATYYLHDGTNTFSCELVSYYVNTGSLTAGTATGTFQLRNIVKTAGSLDKIDSTYSLYSATPPLPGNKVAVLSNDLEYNALVVNPILVQDNTRYEMINANFYADADWDGFYGVNGSGRAFYYTYSGLFAKIFTQYDSTKDKPRHVANHLNHLALGFREGSVQLSVIGEPANYSGLAGAVDEGVGDRITGLMSLNGDTLGIFCEQSIWAVQGSVAENFTLQVLAPHTGCIEYTLVNIGQPVYCNQSGIVTLEQSEKYGNFIGKPLSYKANSWLRPRLNRISGKTKPQYSVVAALPVRAKNQYRLYFKDGEVLTMTLMPEGGEPQFTRQRYYYDDGSSSVLGASSSGGGTTSAEVAGYFTAVVPFALCSQVDSNGEERLFFSHYSPRTGSNSPEVYALDKGWGFVSIPIPHYMETNWFAGEAPNQYYGLHKVRVHGLSKGKANLQIQAAGTQPDYSSDYNVTVESFSLPKTLANFHEDTSPCSAGTNLANRGMSLQLKISGYNLTKPEPSHTLQVLVLQTKPGGKIDG